MRRSKRRRSERGIALIAVLWGLVLVSVIAGSFAATTHTGIRAAHNAVEMAKARALAEAGISRVVLLLSSAADPESLRLDGTPYRFRVGDAEIILRIEDETGRIDLNRASLVQLTGLFKAVGVDPSGAAALADAVVDFRDRNDARLVNGAEDPDYYAAGRAYGAVDRPYAAVEELRQVLGITPALYRAVEPALTVHSRRRRVNMEAAPMIVRDADSGQESRQPEEEGEAGDDGEEVRDLDDPAQAEAITAARRRAAGTYRITARAVTPGGSVFVRRAIVRLSRSRREVFRISEWRRAEVFSREASEVPLERFGTVDVQ